ncbi:MAG: tetratricopeptide repeat protein [Candidatus Wallbacteria bacterium]|nr:tetratricopeptide repeat protein [Candidatus Wallbacteria bacterium]
MSRRKLYFVKYNWNAFFKNPGFDIPDEVPVHIRPGHEITLPDVVNGFLHLVEKSLRLDYLNRFGDFVINLTLNYSDAIVAQTTPEEALALLKKIRRFYSNSGLLNLKISQYYFEAGFPREAGKYIRRAMTLEPDSSAYHTFAGIIDAATGHQGRAEKHWLKAVNLDSGYRKAWLNITNLYNFENRFSKNLELLKKNPHLIDFPEIANQLGISLASLGHFKKAIVFLEKAKKDSEIEVPYLDFNLAQAYMDSRQWKKAMDLYQDIYRRVKSDNTRETLEERINFLNDQLKGREQPKVNKEAGLSFAQIAKEEEFYLQIMKNIEKLKREAEENPDNPWVYYNLGNMFAQLGKFEEAAEQFRKSLEKYEENTLVWHTLGLVYLELGKTDLGLEAIRRAVICRPNDETESIYQQMNFNVSLPYFNLGDIYISKKKFDEAVKAFEKGIEIDARSFLAHYKLGTLMERKKKLDRAEESYHKALILNESFFPVYIDLARLLIKTGRKSEGTMLLRKLLALAPNSEEARAAARILKRHG